MLRSYGLISKRKIIKNRERVFFLYSLFIFRKAIERMENEKYLAFIKEKEAIAN
jgi:hypothetical protein